MEREKLKARLARLDDARRSLYLIGCVTHAKNTVVQAAAPSELQDFAASIRLLDRFWNDSRTMKWGVALSAGSADVIATVTQKLGPEPDEKFYSTPGAETLLWGVVYSLSPDPAADMIAASYGAVDKAYLAVYHYFARDDDAITSGTMDVVEQRTPQCGTELDFQLRYLKYLETVPQLPADLSSLLSNFN